MSHTALARRYRPRRFADVAVQRHASETLRRAVLGDRVGHAYLFCGPRGVGKTTLARVLAMALNCPNRGDDGEPCGECDSCRRIWSGTTALDVVEIDAASNRGVDDARDLRERAMYAPSEEGRSKVYIVDEAHMLTREAWNALLKILEEPPPRVIFVFATTEPQKIEQTAAPILSRCQRFDFRRIGVSDIVARLRDVLETEGVEASDDALRLVARKAEGGMRDGLSVLEQVLAFSDGELTSEVVRRILGVVGDEHYRRLFGLIADRDRGGVFDLIEELVDGGYDLVEFYHGLGDALRSLLRHHVAAKGSELPDEDREDWERVAERFDAGRLVQMLRMASELETDGSLRRVGQPRVLLELLLLRFTYLENAVDLESLLAALGGDASAPPSTAATGPVRDTAERESPSGESARPMAPPERRPPSTADESGPEGRSADARGDLGVESGKTDPAEGLASPGPGPTGEVARPDEATSEQDRNRDSPAPHPDIMPEEPDLERVWTRVLDAGEGLPRGMKPLLRGVSVTSRGRDLTLEVARGPLLDRLRDGEVRAIESAVAREAGGPVTITLLEQEETLDGDDERVSPDRVKSDRMLDLLDKEPGLRPAVEELDLELME